VRGTEIHGWRGLTETAWSVGTDQYRCKLVNFPWSFAARPRS